MITLYDLQSIESGKKYIGITNDLERRLHEHKSGRTKGGQLTAPFILLHTEKYSDYPSAREREKFLKSGQGREWLKYNMPASRACPPQADSNAP